MNYSSNIILKPEFSSIQAVYASQLYGTFFGVFASFHVEESQQDSKVRILKKIDFYLINYKGTLNMSIIDNFDDPEAIQDANIEGFLIKLKVGHHSESRAYQEKVTLDLEPYGGGLEFRENNFLNIERKLIPLAGEGSLLEIHESDSEEVIREKIKYNREKSFHNGLFDSEFFERDGKYVIRKRAIDYKTQDDAINGFPGQFACCSCTPSNNRIIFQNESS